MSLNKEIVEQESRRQAADRGDVHLYKEGTFLRAYDWSAWLCCHYLHDFKVNKRLFKNAIPLTEVQAGIRKRGQTKEIVNDESDTFAPSSTLTGSHAAYYSISY